MQDKDAIKMTFFTRAAEDLKNYDAKIYSYGQAKPVYDTLKDAIASGKNDVLGRTYIDAIFKLTHTKSGPELKELLIKTLEDIYNKRLDAGDFCFNQDCIFKPTQLAETIKGLINQNQNPYAFIQDQLKLVLSNLEKLNEVLGVMHGAHENSSTNIRDVVKEHIQNVKELKDTIDSLRALASNNLQEMNDSIGTVSQSVKGAKESIDELVYKLKNLDLTVKRSHNVIQNTFHETRTLSEKISKLWERHTLLMICGAVLIIGGTALIAYSYGRRNERIEQANRQANLGNLENADNENRDERRNRWPCNIM